MKGKISKLLSAVLGSLGAILFLVILPVMYLLGLRSSTDNKKSNTNK
ncbi:hypothetical protein IGI01_27365 [Bacillus thuringiensis]|nr:hypothetical protein [Bacillus thuringiensis]